MELRVQYLETLVSKLNAELQQFKKVSTLEDIGSGKSIEDINTLDSYIF